MADVCVVGLGYVGLPLACEFAEAGHAVTGYDVDEEKIGRLRDRGASSPSAPVADDGDGSDEGVDTDIDGDPAAGSDAEFEADPETLDRIAFTDDPEGIAGNEYVLLTVPTPLDESNDPDLKFVETAGMQVGRWMSPGTTVVLESTVYPGATREVLVPALEETSQLDAGTDFSVGYSPERVVPGPSGPDLTEITKLVSGLDDETVDDLADLYESILDADVHRAESIEVAEAAKCIENVQRDANIALMNEFALVCDALGVDSRAAIEAAGTKWNFHEYVPGLVGGHCLPVDPYYVLYASRRAGYAPELIESARRTNEKVPGFLADLTADALARRPQAVESSVEGRAGGGQSVGGRPGSDGQAAGGRSDGDGRSAGGRPRDGRSVSGGRSRDDDRRSRDGRSAEGDRPGVLVLGLTYKPNASDVRSAAIQRLVAELRDRDLDVTGFDPHAPNDELERTFGIPVQDDLSVAGYDALVVPVFHDEFADLDLDEVRTAMNDSPILVDAMAALRDRDPAEKGFVYETL